jgi:hypothetical protein
MKASDESEGESESEIQDGGGFKTTDDSTQAPLSSSTSIITDPGLEQVQEQQWPLLKSPIGGRAQRRKQQHLNVQHPTAIVRPSSDSILSGLSLYGGTGHNFYNIFPNGRPILRSPSPGGSIDEHAILQPSIPRTWRTMFWNVLLQSKGLLMVMLSQFFGASMNVMTQVLETPGSHGEALGPFQVSLPALFVFDRYCWTHS